jgi:hypothetical protein
LDCRFESFCSILGLTFGQSLDKSFFKKKIPGQSLDKVWTNFGQTWTNLDKLGQTLGATMRASAFLMP